MSCVIVVRDVDGVKILDCTGRITLGEGADNLRDTIRGLVRSKTGSFNSWLREGKAVKVLVNLHSVVYIDSSGIGELVSGFTTVVNNGGQLRLFGASQKFTTLMRTVKRGHDPFIFWFYCVDMF